MSTKKKDPDPVPDPDPPVSGYECARCGTVYKTMADALACGCQRRGEP